MLYGFVFFFKQHIHIYMLCTYVKQDKLMGQGHRHSFIRIHFHLSATFIHT